MTWLKKFKRKKETQANKEFEKTVNMYTNLPKKCLLCEKEFDKNDKEMLKTWNITVREKEGKVNLYCPKCWSMAMDAIKAGFDAGVKDREGE